MTSPASGSQLPPLPDHLVSLDADDAQQALANPAIPIAPGPIGPVFPRPLRSVRCGCWLLSYRPTGSALVAYDGTLRVECHSAGRTASGDLYQRPVIFLPPVPTPVPPVVRAPLARPILLPPPNPAAGIPILPRSRYRYYVRVTSLPEYFYLGSSFGLGFELWRYTAPNSWALESTLNAAMARVSAPSGYPSASDYAEGDVRNSANVVVGRLSMGWLSKYFRKATIEIDTVAGSERPVTSGVGHDWASVMENLGWQVNVALSDTNVAEPSGDSWSDAEMHAAMLARRATVNLDAEWRYHVLAVKRIDSTPRGIMYDSGGTDSNHVPREGIGIASHWTIDPGWGTVSGQRFGTASAPYFRTAVHEIGHAMGLFHNFSDLGFMCTSDTIAAAGTPAVPFPNNIQWSYHPDNLKQLRHYPDPFVRPGSVAFGGASMTTPPITPADLEVDVGGLALEVEPLLAEIPIGAPVRIDFRLVNRGDRPLSVPADLSLKGEAVAGHVVDPGGAERSFRTVVRCAEDRSFVALAPGEAMIESITLMRGAEGALFATPGVHRVVLEVHWESEGMIATVGGETSVMVTGAVDASHAAAAHKVLSTPDAHLVLAIGGDHLSDGIVAIQAALDSPTLRPHFAVVEAKRLGRRFGSRKANLKAAADLIDSGTVMSGSEIGKMAAIAGAASAAVAKDLGKTLKSKAKDAALPASARQALDEI